MNVEQKQKLQFQLQYSMYKGEDQCKQVINFSEIELKLITI